MADYTAATQQTLLNHIIAFNLLPMSYVHRSWLSQDPYKELFVQLGGAPTAVGYLSDYLLEKFELNDDFDYQFDALEKRIAFASCEEITKLAFYLGVLLHEKTIRTVILSDQQKALQACLGQSTYDFAVKKAQFISRIGDQYAPMLLIDWNHIDKLKQFLLLSGQAVIAQAFRDQSNAFKTRLMLKMPTSWREPLNGHNKTDIPQAQCIHLVIKIHKEVNRQWQYLLT